MYIDLEYYAGLYGNIEQAAFNRLAFSACRKIDQNTTGADGFKKLQKAFPTDSYNAEAVKQCAAALIHYLADIEAAEKAATVERGYEETENGLRRKIISRVESGNEAISYMEPSGSSTISDKAAGDISARNTLLDNVIRTYLDGITDANGVSLLYMGPYPVKAV